MTRFIIGFAAMSIIGCLLAFWNAQDSYSNAQVPVGTDSKSNLDGSQYAQAGSSPSVQRCPVDWIPNVLAELRSDDQVRRRAAHDTLLVRSDESDCVRTELVKALLDSLNSYEDFDSIRFQEPREKWATLVETLGDMQAVEALPYFVDHLDWGGMWSDSHSAFPAYLAVVKLGPSSIPSLTASLKTSRRGVKILSTRALTQIGGPAAESALIDAYQTETDERVREVMYNSINSFSRGKGRE